MDEQCDLFCVNIGLDKTLAPVIDEFGDTIGRVPITDRNAVWKFLDIVKDSNYKYIVIDIRFEKDLKSEEDSALFNTINKMPNVVVSTHRDTELNEYLTEGDNNIVGMSDIRSTGSSDFSKYEYLQSGRESVALNMYHDLHGKTIKKIGPFFLCNSKLCRNMQFLDLYPSAVNPITSEGRIRYPYLSSQILRFYTAEELCNIVSDKIIIIGDYDTDIHSTYIGDVPGPLLAYEAYNALKEGKHFVSWWTVLISFLFYFSISFIVLNPGSQKRINKLFLNVKSAFLRFVLLLIGWGTILLLFKYLLFWFYGIYMPTLIPSIVFSGIATYKSYRLFEPVNKPH